MRMRRSVRVAPVKKRTRRRKTGKKPVRVVRPRKVRKRGKKKTRTIRGLQKMGRRRSLTSRMSHG
jgi:hypothetical protein